MIRIGKSLGKPVIINELCIHYSYDVMSALAYGEAMGFIEGKSTEIADTILRNIQDGVDAIGLLLRKSTSDLLQLKSHFNETMDLKGELKRLFYSRKGGLKRCMQNSSWNLCQNDNTDSLTTDVPWLMATLTSFSFCIGPMKRWNQWSEEQVVTRRSVSLKQMRPD